MRVARTLVPVKLLLGAGACAVLVGAGLTATAAPAYACPYGTVPTSFEGVCVAGQGGGGDAPSGQIPMAVVPNSGAPSILGGGPNQLPTVRGIPCTPQNIGKCIGLMQSAGGQF